MENLRNSQNKYFGPLVLIAILIAVVFGFIQWKLVNSFFVKPVTMIADSFYAAAKSEIPVTTELVTNAKAQELKNLASSFNILRCRLIEYIDNIADATLQKERIKAELDVAQKIQKYMMPFSFPAFPERSDFDLYAEMKPATEVGGDFYDFFFIDPKHLALVIADVSGKGIAAAMFMVIAKTIIKKQLTTSNISLAESIETVNWQLCQGNETNMFVSLWAGIYDVDTHIIEYVNAGHNAPIVKHKNTFASEGNTKQNFALGIMEDSVYQSGELFLDSGDSLFLYTDGVTEAFNTRKKIYGENRLIEKLNSLVGLKLTEKIDGVKSDISEFSTFTKVKQGDDITMLIMRRSA
jgi:sigma-B regulation protein RsbU (phosphoserine phosphatase)